MLIPHIYKAYNIIVASGDKGALFLSHIRKEYSQMVSLWWYRSGRLSYPRTTERENRNWLHPLPYGNRWSEKIQFIHENARIKWHKESPEYDREKCSFWDNEIYARPQWKAGTGDHLHKKMKRGQPLFHLFLCTETFFSARMSNRCKTKKGRTW